MPASMDEVLFFAGSSHPVLAEEVASAAGLRLGRMDLGQFPDGETFVQVHETVRGRDVFIMQSIAREPDRYLMELLLIVDAVKRAAARNVIVVIPYFGYGRQDRRDKPRVPITAKLVADLLQAAGVKQVVTMDLHTEQLQGFFNIPVDSLYARPRLIEALRQNYDVSNLVVATPDVGSVKLVRAYANELKVGMVIVDKERIDAFKVRATTVIGDVNGKDVLLADDMCSTAGTLVSAAKACQEKGARRIFAAVTHGLFVGDSIEKIEASPIEALIVSDTVPLNEKAAQCSKVQTTSVASLFGQAIQCIVTAKSISSVYYCIS
ncbi:MAG: ribose-phosphate pyrophosphokinase [Chlamydiales bacterium]|nr:ribose-phosphate pyrophosphokinase [Chlamydiales bacterium]